MPLTEFRLAGRAKNSIPKSKEDGAISTLPISFATLALVRARTSLGLWSPAPTRNRQQEKQRSGVKETQVGNGVAARSTHVRRNQVNSSEQP
jgi:hypothetical protein